MRFDPVIAMISLLVAGCGGAQQSQQDNGSSGHSDSGQHYQARLQAMPDGERNAVFIRAIRDAQFTCQHVDSSVPAGQGAWVARCSDGSQWQIAIGDEGRAQVTKIGTAAAPDLGGNSS